jgi:hypothetical protein
VHVHRARGDIESQRARGIRKFRHLRRNKILAPTFSLRSKFLEETSMGRGVLLWLLGVPIPVIILLWLFFGR